MIVRTKPFNSAFTIVELLIVIVVIGILAAITIVAFNGIQDRARASGLKSDLNAVASQLGQFNALDGVYPDNINSLEASDTTNLEYAYDEATNSYCITATHTAAGVGAFHRTNGGTIEDGPCTGHSAGDGSVALACPSGLIPVPGNSLFSQSDFCVMKYEAKDVSGVATSQAAGVPWVSITQTNAIAESQGACDGCGLITEAQWLTIAHDVVNVASNWTGGSVGSGQIYRGHSDNSPSGAIAAGANDSDGYTGTGNSSPSEQRRTLTLSNGEVIWDFAGNVWSWTTGQTAGGQPGAGGNAWREWNAVEGTGSLSPDPFPSFGTPAASAWNGSQGIGRLLSDSNQSALRDFSRGGRWNSAEGAGIFALNLFDPPSNTVPQIGFRATRG